MQRRVSRPGVSFAQAQPHQGFDVKGLRKQIEQIQVRNLVTVCGLNIRSRFSLGSCEDSQIARQCRRITGEISDVRRTQIGQQNSRLGAQARPRGIEHYEIGLFLLLLEKLFRVLVIRDDRDTRRFRVRSQVAGGRKICVHAHNSRKSLRERQCEKPHPGIKIKCIKTLRSLKNGLQQILDQESVHLKKRKMVHAKREAARLVNQVSWSGEFKAVLALVQQEQTIELRKRVLEIGNQVLGWLGKTLKRHIQGQLLILRINECFHLQNPRGQDIGARQFLQLPKRFGQSRRKNRTTIDRDDMGAFRKEITKGSRPRVAKGPLRAISIGI